MKTADLVAMLEAVSPGLSDHAMVPLMQHFWFNGNEIVTFNDHQGMLVPCKTSFKGAVPQKLLELLRVSANGTLVFDFGKEDFSVTIGRHIAKFPFLPIDDCADIFTMPQLEDGDATVSNIKFLRLALKSCLLSISNDTSRPELRGITFIPVDEKLQVFSSNNDSFSRGSLKAGEWKLKERVTVPATFCEIFLAMTKDADKDEGGLRDEDVHLQLNPDYALAFVDGAMLYSKVLDVEHPTDFVAIFRENYKTNQGKNLIIIPDELRMLVKRAMVVTESDIDEEKSEIEIKDNLLTYYSKSKRGVVDDEIDFPHVNVGPVKLASKLLKVGLDNYEKICITENCVILTAADRVYMISTTD